MDSISTFSVVISCNFILATRNRQFRIVIPSALRYYYTSVLRITPPEYQIVRERAILLISLVFCERSKLNLSLVCIVDFLKILRTVKYGFSPYREIYAICAYSELTLFSGLGFLPYR